MDEPPETILSALQLDGSNSLYKVQLCTSSMYGSELSDQNAGILVCIIDKHGNSILERIPSIISQDHMLQSKDAVTSEVIRFKRGAIDEFIFLGPKLGRIQAMWISLESGSWRLGGASLTMISVYNYQREESYANGGSYCSITCNFEVEDVLLGEGGDLAMAELRPCLVTEHFGADSVSIVDRNSSQAVSLAEKGITNEDSMKEYENLKYSLLLYDAMLIFAGTSITSITGGKNTGLAFLTGGIGGFLYLLFLQRSVDTLPAPESMGKGNNFNRLFGGLKGTLLMTEERERAIWDLYGSLLLTEERKRAIWALYAWGHRTDELVDGENAHLTGSTVLDSWENRVEDIFDGRPHDILDTALADTVQQFSLDIKPFKDLIKGMRMDTWKTRYENDEELELYCYYVAGTVGLMTVPIIGISPEYVSSAQSIYKAAISMGIGDQLTNILRDVVEDSLLERVYLPQDELREFGMTDKDIFWKNVTEEWREFIKKQIMRARYYYDQAEQGISRLDSASRWPVWASMMLYRANLDKIESNNYDNLTKRARVGRAEKLLTLPLAYAKAMGW
uniref:15-cis-phytoene synthase n=1 Tax=Chenopodium quinoa TaxID=63459 RepID=A0A803KLW0_CHEQI